MGTRRAVRAVAATCGGVRVHSVYVPNGRAPDSDHYHYKLAWLEALRDVVGAGPEARTQGHWAQRPCPVIVDLDEASGRWRRRRPPED